jgi:hypothetical protein
MFLLALFELTLREIVSGIPHDAGAVIAYTLLILFVGFVVVGSRRTGGEGQGSSEA